MNLESKASNLIERIPNESPSALVPYGMPIAMPSLRYRWVIHLLRFTIAAQILGIAFGCGLTAGILMPNLFAQRLVTQIQSSDPAEESNPTRVSAPAMSFSPTAVLSGVRSSTPARTGTPTQPPSVKGASTNKTVPTQTPLPAAVRGNPDYVPPAAPTLTPTPQPTPTQTPTTTPIPPTAYPTGGAPPPPGTCILGCQ